MQQDLVFRPEFKLELPAVPGIFRIDVIGFDIRETLNDGFSGEIDIVSHALLDTAAILDTDFVLEIKVAGRQRYIQGMIKAIVQRQSGFRRSSYTLRVKDPLFRLSLQHTSRIYQVLSAPEIIDKILKEHQFEDVEWRLSNTAYTREYTVQYDETTLSFIQRLLYEEGINYFYETHEENRKLVFCDHNDGFAAISNDPVLPLNDMAGTTMMRSFHVDQFSFERKSGTTSITHSYFAPEAQDKHISYTAADADTAGEKQEFTSYGYQGRQEFREYLNENTSLDEWALHKLRLNLWAKRMNTETARGQSNCPDLAPGKYFQLDEHPDDARNESLVLQSTHHRGVQASALEEEASGSGENHYSVEFDAVPLRLPVVPHIERKATPFDGVHMAKVYGPEGWKGVYTDELGRIKVRFIWDLTGPENGNEPSCWIAPSQLNAGNETGSVSLPHIGDIVLIGYLRGDLEQPYIMGAFQDGRFIRERFKKAMDKITVSGSPFGAGGREQKEEEHIHKSTDQSHRQDNPENSSDESEPTTAELAEFFGGA